MKYLIALVLACLLAVGLHQVSAVCWGRDETSCKRSFKNCVWLEVCNRSPYNRAAGCRPKRDYRCYKYTNCKGNCVKFPACAFIPAVGKEEESVLFFVFWLLLTYYFCLSTTTTYFACLTCRWWKARRKV